MTRYVILLSLFFAVPGIGQELQHLTATPLTGDRPVMLTASAIEREARYPSAIHLKGAVEIKTQVCLPVGKHAKLACDGYTLLRADEATFHEDSGEIEARGAVTVSPLRHEEKKKAR